MNKIARVFPRKTKATPSDDPAIKEFIPGRYLKEGYIFTSRGCNNKCWFCSAWRREGKLREIPITNGWNVLDNNFLQCSRQHILDVFEMLKRQKHHPVFTGGLEAKELRPWHCDLLRESKTQRMYFAYDTKDDYEPLVVAGKMLRDAGINPRSHVASCYCLIGYNGDTFEDAEKRLIQTIDAGFMPYAMLFRDSDGNFGERWKNTF